MSSSKPQTLDIDPHLQARLGVLASKQGASLTDFAERVLRSYADEAERAMDEQADDESRWQRYLETGSSVSFDTIRAKLRGFASEAALKAESP